MSQPVSFYEEVGGEETFTRLVHRFYQGVAADPVLRPVYPAKDLGPAEEHLRLFLMQYWGGPRTYDELRGHPRLRMRHARFAIGEAERDAWLRHMRIALDELELDEALAAQLWDTWSWPRTAWSTWILRTGARTSGSSPPGPGPGIGHLRHRRRRQRDGSRGRGGTPGPFGMNDPPLAGRPRSGGYGAPTAGVLQRRPLAWFWPGSGAVRTVGSGQRVLPGRGVRQDHAGDGFDGEAAGVEAALRAGALEDPGRSLWCPE